MNYGRERMSLTPIDRRIRRFDWKQFASCNDNYDVAADDRRRRLWSAVSTLAALSPMIGGLLIYYAYL
jgi:hypothetical protein